MTTIRQSEYIEFNGVNSQTLGIINVNISSGLLEEPLVGSKSINETKVRGRDVPFFHGVENEPLSFELSLAFENEWTSDQIREVMRWLYVTDYYVPLVFSSKPDQRVYGKVVGEPKLVHNSNNGGYIIVNFRTDSPYFHGAVESVYYDLITNPAGGTNIEIMNNSDLDIPCNVLIKKKNDGDIAIVNLSNSGETISVTGLKDGSYLLIDAENEDIESSATGTLTFTGVVNDGETVTINGRVFEFDSNNLISGGNVKVDVSTGTTASQSVTALVNAINNDVQGSIDAVSGSGTSVILYTRKTGVEGKDYATSETCANASFSGTTFTNVYNHNTWNENILKLIFGKNNINIQGQCEIKFIYQYKFLAGE